MNGAKIPDAPPVQQATGLPELSILLEQPLDVHHPAVLREQLSDAEAWTERVSRKYRNQQNVLAQMRRQWLLPMDRATITELDRTVRLEAITKDVQLMVDLYGDQLDILRNRITLGIALLGTLGEPLREKAV